MNEKEFINLCRQNPWCTDEYYARAVINNKLDNAELVEAAKNYIDALKKFFDLLNDVIKKEQEDE